METDLVTSMGSASQEPESSTHKIKLEPSEVAGVIENTAVTSTANEFAPSSSVPSENSAISDPLARNNTNSLKEQESTAAAAVNNDMVEVKTEPFPDMEQSQNNENTNVSSTATTPERPTNDTEEHCTTTKETSVVKEEPPSAALDPEDFLDDLLRDADQISEQMSTPNIKDEGTPTRDEGTPTLDEGTPTRDEGTPTRDEEPISNQSATTAPPAIIKSIPVKPPQDHGSNEVYNRSGAGAVDDAEPEAIPANFFDDLLQDRVAERINIKNEPNDVPSNAVAETEIEAIPANFFDDLLQDRVAQRAKRIEHEGVEIKYSEKIKQIQQELRELDKKDEAESPNKNKKHKHKKSKKKSHKRSRNREDDRDDVNASLDNDSSQEAQRKRRRHNRSPITNSNSNDTSNGNLPRVATQTAGLTINKSIFQTAADNFPAAIGVPVELAGSFGGANLSMHATDELPGCSAAFSPFPLPFMVKPEPSNFMTEDNEDALNCLPVQQPSSSSSFNAFSGFKKIKLEMPSTKVNIKTEGGLTSAPATKRQIALDHAAKTIKQLQAVHNISSSGFQFASTVRKLPTSSSYVTQQIYDNRSPLHTINNVDYAFNSNSTRFNLHEWGLEAMPKVVAKGAKIIGYDADALFAKIKSNKNSNKFNMKIKREKEDGEEIDETKSSFFTNAMTQTDDVTIVSERKRKGHDIGMQAMPSRASIGTQTTFETHKSAVNNDLPLMKLINQLNEHQLLALNDFAELVREPASSTAMDMYRLRQRMLEIYKCSQMAPAVTPPFQVVSVRSLAPNPHPNPYPNMPQVRAAAPNHNSHYQNVAPVRPPPTQPIYRATTIDRSNMPTQYMQHNPVGPVLNQIPVHMSLQQQQQQQQPPQQPTIPQHIPYQRMDPRLNAAFPVQPPINTEYQAAPPSNYQIPHNPLPPGPNSYGHGGMRR